MPATSAGRFYHIRRPTVYKISKIKYKKSRISELSTMKNKKNIGLLLRALVTCLLL